MRVPNWLVTLALVGLAACDTLDPGEPGNLVPLTVAEDASLPAIDMNGSRFHVETQGDPANPVIVFLHGGPGGDYRSLLRMAGQYGGYRLTDEYFLVFWDQRGSGLSMRHDKSVLTLAVYTADLHALVNRYSPGRPVFLVGHSWGGMFATHYINTYPDRVAGAVLIEPGPLDGATMERIKGQLFDLDLRSEWLNDLAWSTQFFTAEDHARMDYERLLGLKHSQPGHHIRTDFDPEPVWRAGAAANRYLEEDVQDAEGVAVYDFTTNLSRYTTPVLFIAGSRSEILGQAFQQQQMQRFPQASLHVVSQAGHDVQWTHTPDVLTQVRAYLSARQGASQ